MIETLRLIITHKEIKSNGGTENRTHHLQPTRLGDQLRRLMWALRPHKKLEQQIHHIGDMEGDPHFLPPHFMRGHQ